MPTLKRMFISKSDIERKFTSRGRKLAVSGPTFAHLRLPSGSQAYPETYIDALVMGVRARTVKAEAVLLYNQQHGQRLIEAAHRELLRRIEEREVDGLLTLADLIWILSITSPTILSWCKSGLLPSEKANGRVCVRSLDLLTHCSWVVPTP